jgi:hypothetical protein
VLTTWERVHAGDIVLGYDEQTWGVVEIRHDYPPGPVITLTPFGQSVTGWAPLGTPVTVVSPVDTSAEAAAFAALTGAGLTVEILRESYQP